MRLNILIGGKAGQGINELASIITRALAATGYYVFNYREYGSWIAGGHNFNVICMSDKKTGSIDYDYEVVLALDDKTLETHKKDIKKDCLIISEKNVEVKNEKVRNVYFAAALFKSLCISKEVLLKEIERKFKGKALYEDDIKAVEESYKKEYGKKINCKKEGKPKLVMGGNEGVAMSALDSGLNVYFGYPMTPATGVLTMLAQAQKNPENKHFVFEPENEIAVANMALGASFAGKRAMVGSSGGGFDLMTEALSAGGIMELPLVIHMSQRGSNSTGVPTYTGQGSLNDVLYSGNGEFARVVLTCGDSKEAWDKTREAFYFAEKFNCASIILTDKHIVESDYSFDDFKKSNVKITEREIKLGKEIIRTSSYEHNEKGHTTEKAEEIAASIKKRVVEKIKNIEKEARKFEMYKVYGEGKNLIVSYGSNKGAILDAMDDLKDLKYLHLLYLEPFPEEIIKELEKAKQVFLVEADALGQVAGLIRQKTGFKIEDKNKILKYDARAFTPKELIAELKRRLK